MSQESPICSPLSAKVGTWCGPCGQLSFLSHRRW